MEEPRKRLSADERRPQILKCAVRVFARSNYRAATVAEVAAEAGISEALIYKFFPSKKSIFLEILRRMSERIVSAWQDEQDREENAVRALRNMGMGYYKRMIRHPDELRVQFQAISEVSDKAIADQLREDHRNYMRSITKVLRRGMRQGTIREGLDVTAMAFLFNGVGILMNMMRLLAFEREFTEARTRALIDHLLDSIKLAAPVGKAHQHAATDGTKP
ncbi:MAG: TetR/AcrR family transcriptional regulator [Candidatus Binataceae bacterium]